MPAALVDPTIKAQGPIPASPIGNMLSGIVGAYAQQFPNAMESTDMRYKNAATQKLDMENMAPGQLQELFTRAYKPMAPNPQPGGQVQGSPLDTAAGGVASPQPSRDQMVSSALPELAGAMARAGQYSNIGNMFRTFTANAPGITAVSDDPKRPSPVSMSMLGAGDAYTSTPDAALTGATPGQRDRNAKMASIMANNPGMSQQRAANIVDGIFEYPQDPVTKNMFEINKATGEQRLMRQGNTQVTPGTNTVRTPTSSTPPARTPTGQIEILPNGQKDNVEAVFGNNDIAQTNAPAPAFTSAAPVTPVADSPVVNLGLKRGDLGVNFDQVYGGPATAGRIVGGISALAGNSEANSGATQGLSDLNSIKNQLISIKNLQMGMRSNAAAQARFAQELPATNPELLNKDALMEGATTGAGTAEQQIMTGLEGAVQDRIADAAVFADPNTSAEERQYTQERINKTDKLFAGLPAPVQQAYQRAISGQKPPPVEPTNLERGQAAVGGKVRVTSPDGRSGFIDANELNDALGAGWKRVP